MTLQTQPAQQSSDAKEPAWGNSYRLVASEKWKAKSAAMGRGVTDALVEYAAPRPAMKVLDLASGTGEPAISVAMLVGAAGQVTALDLSSELLEIAAHRARDRGLQNLTTCEADAHSLPFEDNSFDLATSRFGVMFFREVGVALRELLRVLRPNARACFAVWGPFEQPYWQTTMGIVHKRVGGPLLRSGGPNPFRFSKPGSLSEVLKSAGFQRVHEETKTVPWSWPGSPQDVWEQAQAVAVPFRPMLDRIPSSLKREIDAEVLDAVGKYVRGDKIEFGASIVLASGQN